VIELGSIVTADAALAAGRKLAESHVDAVALAPASWFEDYLVLDLIEECNRPVLFWPQPGMETGALCGNPAGDLLSETTEPTGPGGLRPARGRPES